MSTPPTVTTLAPVDGTGVSVGEYYALDGVRFYGPGDYTHVEVGEASWYGARFHGNPTANGEIYDRHALTAAHPTLDLPSIARVTNLSNGRSIIVRINDRGPYAGDRIIDLSEQAARRLEFIADGVAEVRVEVLPDESDLASRFVNGGADVLVAGRDTVGAGANASLRRGTDALVRGGGPGWVQTAAAASDPATMDAVRSGMLDQDQRQGPFFFVEAGAYLIRDNAERALGDMENGDAARITSRLVDGVWVYRIQAGPHTSVTQADAALGQLRNAGHSDAVIVRD